MLKSLAIRDWPKSDREAWETACRPSVRLKRGGSASNLAACTRDDLQRRYGYLLTFLKECGRLEPDASCASLMTPETIAALICRMRGAWSATTLFMTIHKLKQIARHLAPSANFKWLTDVAGDLKAEDGPVKRRPVVDATELLTAGLTLAEEYSACHRPMDLTSALNIRNGLMVAFLASCPIRAKNFAALTLGQSLHFSDSCWWIDLEGSETKSGRPDMRMFPAFLSIALELYLLEARPFLLSYLDPREANPQAWTGKNNLAGDSMDDAAFQIRPTAWTGVNGEPGHDNNIEFDGLAGPLWISRYGSPMTYSGIHHALTSVTEATIGIAVAPHGFRHAAATTAAWKAGAMPHLASGILQHQDRRITDASYIRATSFEAARQLGKILRRR
jgi:integrase